MNIYELVNESKRINNKKTLSENVLTEMVEHYTYIDSKSELQKLVKELAIMVLNGEHDIIPHLEKFINKN